MPVHQSRIISLLNAGLDYKQALEQIIITAHHENNSLQAGQTTYEEAYQALTSVILGELLLDQGERSDYILRSEQFHFDRHSERNKREAERARENRRKAREDQYNLMGVPPGETPNLLQIGELPMRQPGQDSRGRLPKEQSPKYGPGVDPTEAEEALRREKEEADAEAQSDPFKEI